MPKTQTDSRAKAYKSWLILLIILAICFLFALAIGSEWVNPFNVDQTGYAILYEIRLPRILLAIGVGICLSTSGASLQAMLRNPLAEPYLLGVSNGAALGTILAILFAGSNAIVQAGFAFGGAAFAMCCVYALSKTKAGINVERLVLSGVIITSLLSAVIILLTGLLDAARLRGFTFWLLGDLSGAGYPGAIIAIGAGLLGTAICFFKASALNLMMVGERDAVDFGVELNSTRLVIFIAASLMVGAAVAAGGSVGYVGLVIPHLIRLAMGSDNRLVIPSSAIGGAAFVVLADMLARSVAAPRELPIGAITALIGAPIFVHLLARK